MISVGKDVILYVGNLKYKDSNMPGRWQDEEVGLVGSRRPPSVTANPASAG